MNQSWRCWSWKLAGASLSAMGGAIASSLNCALAQITPDGTLPNNSRVTTGDNIRIIEGGHIAGSNLFHSFEQFSVPTGSTAYFNNAVDIQNIISRVTGKSVSNIDGLIRANGAANLFLLNPNGIIFGRNASLNIGGSFVATTANAIQFGNQGFFRADNPNTPPLLTVNPSAFLFNQIAAAPIQNNSVAPAGLDSSGFDTFGLRVPDGRSLLLVGGNISMDGGGWYAGLNAFGGRVELGGLAGAGTVGLNTGNNLSLSFPQGVPRADVSLTNRASANVIAGSVGSIAINARNLDISGNSQLLAGIGQGLGSVDSQAGDIELRAQGAINVANGFIFNNVEVGAIGNAGNIDITTGSLEVKNGARLSASTSGQGSAGSVTISVSDTVSFNGVGSNGLPSSALSNVELEAIGNAGNINITTGSLSVKNGAQLESRTREQGNAGSVTINASDTVSFDGEGSDGWFSGAYSTVEATAVGKGGNINITTGSLSATNGARLSASTSGQGNAGSVTINASDTVSFNGVGSNGLPSSALSNVELEAIGNAGNINITTGSLSVKNGAQLESRTREQGNAGSVNINARDTVSFDGVSSNGWSSGAYSTVEATAVGNAGNIDINATGELIIQGRANISTVAYSDAGNAGDVMITTGRLILQDGGYVSAANANIFNQGNGGSLTVNASESVELTGISADGRFPSGLFTGTLGTGNAGDLTINTGRLTVQNGAVVASFTLAGQGGNLTVNAQSVKLSGTSADARTPSLLSTDTAGAKNAGDLTINTEELIVENGAAASVSTFGEGQGGRLTVNVSEYVQLSGTSSNGFSSGLYAQSFAAGNAGDLTINTGELLVQDSARVTVAADNATDARVPSGPKILQQEFGFIIPARSPEIGNAGNLEIASRSIKLDNRGVLRATTLSGEGGNITLREQDLILMRRNSEISTEARGTGNGGNIEFIDADLLVAVSSENSDIIANAYEGNGGSIDITASGIFGLEYRDRNTSESDITASSEFGVDGVVEINTPDIDPAQGLVNLPTVPTETEVVQACQPGDSQAQSEFIITGRGGLPPNPTDFLNTDAVWIDLDSTTQQAENRPSSEEATQPTNPTPGQLVEANGWVLNDKGEVVLIASAPTATPHNPGLTPANCHIP